MKEKKNIFLGLLIAASLLLTTGCPTPVDGGNGGKDLRVRVTYNAGTGNTSGTVPEDTTVYDVGNTVTVLDNTGNLVGALVGGDHAGSGIKQRFIGWNTVEGYNKSSVLKHPKIQLKEQKDETV